MAYFIPKHVKPLPCFCIVEDVFDSKEITKIQDLEDLQKFQKAAVGATNTPIINESVRNSDIMWIHPDRESEWLFSKFAHLASNVNQDFFLYEIEMLEAFQYTIYRENHNHYSWHIDHFTEYQAFERKISATILLSDPVEYDGGEFQIVTNGNIANPETHKLKKGSVIFFASWMPHQVLPVTKGIRKSLVAWIQGKRQI
jgi:PKHD-type hydroxylase